MSGIKKIFQSSFIDLKKHFCESIASVFFLIAVFLISILCCGFTYLCINKEQSLYMTQTSEVLMVSLVFLILMVFVLFPLELGIKRWFYNIAKSKEPQLKEIFYYFSNGKVYIQSLIFRTRLFLLKFAIILLALLPSGLLYLGLKRAQEVKTLSDSLIFGGLVLLIFISLVLGIAFILGYNHRYFLVNHLYFEDEKAPFKAHLLVSHEISKKKIQPIVQLYLFLLPILLLCFLIVPILVVVPFSYVITSNKAYKAYRENIYTC